MGGAHRLTSREAALLVSSEAVQRLGPPPPAMLNTARVPLARSGSSPRKEAELRLPEVTSQPPRITPNTYTQPCVPAGILTSLNHKDDVVQARLEAPVPEVQSDMESLAPANEEALRADLLRVVLHVVPGALEVCGGQLQPCHGAAWGRRKSRVMEPGLTLTTTY